MKTIFVTITLGTPFRKQIFDKIINVDAKRVT